MRTLIAVVIGLCVVAGAAREVWLRHQAAIRPPQIAEQPVTPGNVVETVIATGAVSADRAVSVGTQVSGLVTHVYVDFNSIVRKGELLAELDPAPTQAELDSARAMLGQAELTLAQHEAERVSDEVNAGRAETLYAGSLLDDQDREAAEAQVLLDRAQLSQDTASVEVARAAVSGAETDLANCRITSPIDGVVIERDVDVGQAVASRVVAPTLFVLATDLHHLRVVGDVDESDVAKIHTGEPVVLSVDAYPDTTFPATVTSARLNATVASNVVTYQVVADVDNSALKLRPGMTATMRFEIWRAEQVLRVPSAGLRFRPTVEMFTLLHQTPVPVPLITPVTKPTGTPAQVNAALSAKPDGREGPGAVLVDSLFAAPVAPERAGQVWVLRDQQLTRVPVRTGISDGRWTALVDGELKSGDEVVTNIVR